MNEPSDQMSRTFVLQIEFGEWETESRLVTYGDGWAFQSRKRFRHQCGAVGPWSSWEESGVRLIVPQPERPPRAWWKFWNLGAA